jgi:hypothetical protein
MYYVYEAADPKLCWELVTSDNQWIDLLEARVMRSHSPISYHIGSSIWTGIKGNFFVLDNCH